MRRIRSLIAIAVVMIASSCKPQQPREILIRGMDINGYKFDYELSSPGSIQADARDVHINTGKVQIDVVDGTLRVAGKSFGAVKVNDHIAVDGDKVRVNGELRKEGST